MIVIMFVIWLKLTFLKNLQKETHKNTSKRDKKLKKIYRKYEKKQQNIESFLELPMAKTEIDSRLAFESNNNIYHEY